MRRLAVGLLPFLLGVVITGGTPTAAEPIGTNDGNDFAGSNDIRRVEVERDGEWLVHSIEMFDPIQPLGTDEVVGFGFSTDRNRSDLERVVFFFVRGARWHWMITNGTGRRTIDEQTAGRPDDTKLEAVIHPDQLKRGLKRYLWFGFSVVDAGARCCSDYAPNRGWVRGDVAGPRIDGPRFGAAAGRSVASTALRTTFEIRDVGGSGAGAWTLRSRDPSVDLEWTDVGSGLGRGPFTVPLAGSEGHTYDVCVVASDRAGNTATSVGRVVVPLDDAGGAFSFSGGWTSAGQPDDFMGTRHIGGAGDSFDVLVPPGRKMALVMPGGFDGTARVTSAGADLGTFSSSGLSGPRNLVRGGFGNHATSDERSFHVVVESGTFAIDGFVVVNRHRVPRCVP